ncbi:MAG: hypothetical protein E7172_02270 [Firmicutes bacterium]|nr:hypothetical protein [Bacillota bacterium]
MEAISNFIINNYWWFLIITIILVLALIGYFFDMKYGDLMESSFKKRKNEILNVEEINLDKLNLDDKKDMSLNTMINNNQDQSLAEMMDNLSEEKSEEKTIDTLEML